MALVGSAILAGVAVNGISKALGWASGGEIKKDGLYELHKGELVIPAAEAKKMISAYKKHKGHDKTPISITHRYMKEYKTPKKKKK